MDANQLTAASLLQEPSLLVDANRLEAANGGGEPLPAGTDWSDYLGTDWADLAGTTWSEL